MNSNSPIDTQYNRHKGLSIFTVCAVQFVKLYSVHCTQCSTVTKQFRKQVYDKIGNLSN